ncbi:MAG: hypothetical protein R3C11_04865 [Planctomycetaceae bacterium]
MSSVMNAEIESITRGRLVLKIDARRFSIGIEALIPKSRISDFVVYPSDVYEIKEGNAMSEVDANEK